MNVVSRIFSACAWLLVGSVAGATDAVPSGSDRSDNVWTVEQVVASLKEKRESEVSFEETTYSSLLAKPLVGRGVLRFTPPSRVEKDVREPYRERYIVEGDLVTFESERRRVTRTVSLEEYPGLRGIVDAFRAVLSGDAARLKQAYEMSLVGDRHKWVLSLHPRDQAGKMLVDSIELSGSEGRIGTITIRAPDGDRSVMTLSRGVAP